MVFNIHPDKLFSLYVLIVNMMEQQVSEQHFDSSNMFVKRSHELLKTQSGILSLVSQHYGIGFLV